MTTDTRYVEENSGRSSYTIRISSDRCGSQMGPSLGDGSITELTNTIIVQNDKDVQEIWDVARRINCEWIDNYVKTVNFNPFTVGMLQAQEVKFQGDQPVECWMDLQQGKYPDISNINSIMKIGDSLSLLVYARDNDYQYDVAVKDCYAFAGPDYNNPNTPKLQLTDEEGCVLKDKLISPFYTAREDDGIGSTIVTYAHVSAFKFPDVMDVFMTCNVEICKGDCDTRCSPKNTVIPTTEKPRRSGSTLFGEPIYTTKPTTIQTTTIKPTTCYPGSNDPQCRKGGKILFPSPNECVPGSNDPRCFVTVPYPSPRITTRRPSTTPKPRCYVGSSDPRCPKAPVLTPILVPKCYPGSKDPRCPKPPRKCYPGSKDPNCPLTCVIGSNDPRCKKGKSIDSTVCYPGSRAKECQPSTTAPPPTTPKCYPGSLDPNCQFTTKDGRYGSILFPATITTPPTTTTRRTTPYTVPIRTTKPTTKKPSGSVLFSNPLTTKRPKPTAAPKLKPRTTTKSPPRGKQIFSEPKSKPEPTGKEWEGESRFHAFHSYHFQRGDGRRSRTFGQRIVPKTRKTRRVIRSVTGNEPPRPLLAKVPLQLTRTMHVALPLDYPSMQVQERIVDVKLYEADLCFSPIAVMSFGLLFLITTVSSSVFLCLYFKLRKQSSK